MDYVKNYYKFITYDIIKIKIDKDLTNFYLIV